MKEVWAKLKEKIEALTSQEKLLEERMVKLMTDAANERSEFLDTQNQIIERSRTTLERV